MRIYTRSGIILSIIYINFEDRLTTEQIQTWKDIVTYIEENRKVGMCYVFLDEIQEIDGWQYACKTLRLRDCSIFITGSNSKRLDFQSEEETRIYLSEAYIIDQADRYNRKAKRVLENSRKLYNCDVGLNSIRCLNKRYDLTHNLENIVYNELLYMGYKVSVYDNNGREVDFLAENGNYRFFIQVAYSVAEEKAYKREMSAFQGLDQVDKKILITNDDIDYSTSNVKHIQLKDFLLLDTL